LEFKEKLMPQKGKHRPPHRKEKKQRVAQAPAPAQTQPAQTQSPTSIPSPVKVARTATLQSAAAFTQARFPFIGAELKLIGSIAAALIIVLVILAIVLPPLLP